MWFNSNMMKANPERFQLNVLVSAEIYRTISRYICCFRYRELIDQILENKIKNKNTAELLHILSDDRCENIM